MINDPPDGSVKSNSGFDDNPLISNQAAYLQFAYNLSADNIGMQNPISDSGICPRLNCAEMEQLNLINELKGISNPI
ncbi:hypothetical protein [Xenorhabdus bovienii]|uniref:hypothetical protein n=1 Tax=Xenorhabdus bovienii TaxID=40576 RepID=UPI0023B33527|nr:hypothetical protein [Xenorhabdus bovienii]MDE9538954.1 hypothetical protein [Xenorhabdus bovienii]